jgi:hypothetical protein
LSNLKQSAFDSASDYYKVVNSPLSGEAHPLGDPPHPRLISAVGMMLLSQGLLKRRQALGLWLSSLLKIATDEESVIS